MIIDPQIGKVEQAIVGAHTNTINSVVVYEGPDGPRTISAGRDERMVICDPYNGKIVTIIEGAHTNSICDVCVFTHPLFVRVVSAGNEWKINFWDLEEILAWNGTPSTRPQPINTLFVKAQCLAIDQANNRLICGVGNHIEIYEFVTYLPDSAKSD